MSGADFYTGIVPAVYSALRGTVFDPAPYVNFVLDIGQPALELGCGDDGPFLELARRGIDIEGVDSSAQMLARCRVTAAVEGLSIVTHCQSMQNLSLSRIFRSIYLAGPTFNLLPDDRTASRTLMAIARHLSDDGQALIHLWIPPPTDPAEIGNTEEARTADGAIARYTVEAEDYDPVARARFTHTRYELSSDGHTEQLRRDWIIHWYEPNDFLGLADGAGLDVVAMSAVTDGEFNVRLRRK